MVLDESGERCMVFTEHCGYHVFPVGTDGVQVVRAVFRAQTAGATAVAMAVSETLAVKPFAFSAITVRSSPRSDRPGRNPPAPSKVGPRTSRAGTGPGWLAPIGIGQRLEEMDDVPDLVGPIGIGGPGAERVLEGGHAARVDATVDAGVKVLAAPVPVPR